MDTQQFFYMIQGDMCLRVIEGGRRKDIRIQEGHALLLPPRVPHSPQRGAGTFGLVVERARLPDELDGLRFYSTSDSTSDPIYEHWFHCSDLGSQLAPVITQFFNSHEFRSDKRQQSKRMPCHSCKLIFRNYLHCNQTQNRSKRHTSMTQRLTFIRRST